MKRILPSLITSFLFYILNTSVAFAQSLLPVDPNICGPCLTTGECHLSQIPCYIKFIAQYLVGIVGTVSVVMLMIGGYQWIMSGISEDQKGKAKKTIWFALLGMIIALLSWVIVNFIQVTVTT